MYLVWAYYDYYPSGPDDLQKICYSREQAERYIEENLSDTHYDNVEITEYHD